MTRDDTELDHEAVAQIAAGQGAHAYLLSGGGEQTEQLARLMCQAAVCTSRPRPCGQCGPCLSVAERRHLDVRWLEATTPRLRIEQVRTMRLDAFLEPITGPRKVYVIKDAHKLTLEAANALLKILEEPPEYVVIILTTSNPRGLPATVVSRCRVVRTGDSERLVEDYEQIQAVADEGFKVLTAGDLTGLMPVGDSILQLQERPLIIQAVSAVGDRFRRLAASGPESLSAVAGCLEDIQAGVEALDRNANVKMCVDALLVKLYRRLH